MRCAAILLALVACKDKPAPKPREADKVEKPSLKSALETADVDTAGTLPASGLGPKVAINDKEITVNGESVMTIATDAPLVRRDLEALTTRLEGKVKGDEPVALTIEPTLPYYRFAGVFDALHKAGFRKLALITGNGAKMIPLDTLDSAEANRGGLRPTVTIKRGRLTLWSGSGEEGTRAQPKLAYDLTESPSFQPLTHALAEIVQRRWPDGRRTDADRVIFVQVDGGTTAQVLLGALAAVRVEGTLSLFPSIFLAGGA
jgi:biopolymer transport protein ExbD